MALRDQPYLPLYVQDVLTDERLIECSAEAHGVYFRLLCILHKQETYGLICLKQKYKQTESKFENFALMICKQMPFQAKQIAGCLEELATEGVISVEDDTLYQKRMKKDGEISLLRSEVGKKGGSNVTKQYGKRGFVYLMSDGYNKNKIGISVNPQNRLYRLRSDLNLPKHFDIKRMIEVVDMGASEDFAQDFYSDIIDGEWLVGDFKDINERFVLLEANLKANNQAIAVPNAENEYENENNINSNKIENIDNRDKEEEEKKEESKVETSEKKSKTKVVKPESETWKKTKAWMEENCRNVTLMKEPFTEEQFDRIKEKYSQKQIITILTRMHNYAPLLKKNISANLTFRDWAKKDFNGADMAITKKQNITPAEWIR